MNLRTHFIPLLFLLFLQNLMTAVEPIRTWTSSDGRTLEARFIEQVGSNVKIERSDGQIFEVQSARFSVDDQNYIQSVLEKLKFSEPIESFSENYQGAIIIGSTVGEVKIIDPPEEDIYSDPTAAKPRVAKSGELVKVGSKILTGKQANAVIILTNGTSVSIGENSNIDLKNFWQKEFEGDGRGVNDIEEEVSPSRITFGLNLGDMIIDVKKLQFESSFLIQTSVGVAGIRGTQFRLRSNKTFAELGVLEGRVDFLGTNNQFENIQESRKLQMEQGIILSDLPEGEKGFIKKAIEQMKLVSFKYSTSELSEYADDANPKQAALDPDDGGILEKLLEFQFGQSNPGMITKININSIHDRSFNFKGVEYKIKQIKDLRPLTEFKNLETISIKYMNQNKLDLSPLSGLTNMRKVDTFMSKFVSIQPLQSLKNLEHLHMTLSGVSDLTPFELLTNLNFVQLSNNRIKNLRPLENLTKIETLILSGNGGITDISSLANLTELIELNLRDCSKIEDYSPLFGLRKLRRLDLSGHPVSPEKKEELKKEMPLCEVTFSQGNLSSEGEESGKQTLDEYVDSLIVDNNNKASQITSYNHPKLVKIENLNPIEKLPYLESFSIGLGANLETLNGLPELKYLKKIYLHSHKISDLSLLSRFSKLENLQVSSSRITDLTPIKDLNELKTLNLNRNQISNLEPLAKLRNLEDLNLSENQVSDISPLLYLKNLKKLSLRENPINESEKGKLQRALGNCEITF